jgi:lysophospholipase L1-like esterase
MVEGALRLMQVSIPLAVSDRELGIVYRKGVTEETTNPESGQVVTVSVNQDGFRDDAWEPTDRPRVFVVGDSFVLAAEVAKEERFTELLEQWLDYTDTNRAWDVVNAGVSGTGPDTYLARMRAYIPKLNPEYTVVVIYNGNDFHNVNYAVTPGGGRMNYEVVDGVAVPHAPRASLTERLKWEARMLLSQSYLVQLINKRLTLANAPAAPTEHTVALPEYCTLDEATLQDSFIIMRAILSEMRDVTEGKMLVVSVPDKAQFEQNLPDTCDRTKIESFLAQEMSTLNVPFLPLYERFASMSEPLYFAGHLNIAGHKVAAQAIFEALRTHVFN